MSRLQCLYMNEIFGLDGDMLGVVLDGGRIGVFKEEDKVGISVSASLRGALCLH